jgi:hypothetical protein
MDVGISDISHPQDRGCRETSRKPVIQPELQRGDCKGAISQLLDPYLRFGHGFADFISPGARMSLRRITCLKSVYR